VIQIALKDARLGRVEHNIKPVRLACLVGALAAAGAMINDHGVGRRVSAVAKPTLTAHPLAVAVPTTKNDKSNEVCLTSMITPVKSRLCPASVMYDTRDRA